MISTKGMHAIGRNRARCKDSMLFSTQSTHKLLAGLSQASQILVQDSESRQLDRDIFNESIPDAYVHLAAIRHHRFLRRGGGHDGTTRRHSTGGRIHCRSAGFPPRHA